MRRRLDTATAAGLAFCLLLTIPLTLPAAQKHGSRQYAEPADNAALVYLVRQKKMQGKARTFFVFADDTLLGTLDNGCYTYAYVPPGERLFWLNFARISERVKLEPGETYHFNLTPTGASFSSWVRFEDVGEEWGRALIDEVPSFCTPDDKEIAKADEYVANRMGKAERLAAKQPQGRYWYSREKSVGSWPHADLAPYSILYIEDFALTDPKADERKKEMQVKTAGSRIADRLKRQLDEGLFAEVRRESPSEPVEGAVVLRGELTQYKPGSRVARGFLIGTSNSHLDFTVRVVDAASGDELAAFSAKRVWAWGGIAGDMVGIEDLEESLAFELSVYLEECKTGRAVEPEAPET
jgi:hypothetical protein